MGLRLRDAGLRLERGERLARRRHLLGETRDHAARRVVLVQRVTQLLNKWGYFFMKAVFTLARMELGIIKIIINIIICTCKFYSLAFKLIVNYV